MATPAVAHGVLLGYRPEQGLLVAKQDFLTCGRPGRFTILRTRVLLPELQLLEPSQVIV